MGKENSQAEELLTMLFGQTVEYALRATACLAMIPLEELLSSDAIAEQAFIPAPYVPKVMRPLVECGLVEARRGRGGGFRLARPAAQITLMDVLMASGVLPPQGRCAFGHMRCNSSKPCPLHESSSGLTEAIRRWATGHTLAGVSASGSLEMILSGKPSS